MVKTSSRLYAALQLSPRQKLMQKSIVEHGRLMFKKLAGSESDVDTNKTYKRTRIEGVDINTSLLAQKNLLMH